MNYIKSICILVVALVLVSVYALCPWEVEWLEKADYTALVESSVDSTEQSDSVVNTVVADTVAVAEPKRNDPDSTAQRILFIGDSMLEGLSARMNHYAKENGHYVASVIWYSSTSEIWAGCDTLEHFMKLEKPTFVMICLGSNEQFVRDLAKRDKYVKQVIAKLKGLDYIWICPPSWKKDTGIDSIILKNVGKGRFFDSRKLTYKRGKDNIHPTMSSAAQWMDSVAVWMQSEETQHPIIMQRPEKEDKAKFKRYVLQPVAL